MSGAIDNDPGSLANQADQLPPAPATAAPMDPASYAAYDQQQSAIAPPSPTTVVPTSPDQVTDTSPSLRDQLNLQQQNTRQSAIDANDPTKVPLDDSAPAASFTTPSKSEGALADFGRQVWISTVQSGQAAVGAASFTASALGADPNIVAHIQSVKADIADYAADQAGKMSPEAQDAMHASIFGGKGTVTPGSVGWKNYVGATVASLVPQVAAALLPGKLVATVAFKLATEGFELAAGTSAGVSTAASVGTTAATFGTLDAGQAYNDLTDGIDNASVKTLMQSPVYAQLVGGGMSDSDARKQLVSAIAPTFVGMHFAAGAAAGAVSGELLGSGAAGAAGKGVLGRVALGAGEGGVALGTQSAGDNAADQTSAIALGQQSSFDPSAMATSFAKGALGGVALGALGGAVHGGGSSDAHDTATPPLEPDLEATPLAPATVSTSIPPVPADIQQAMANVLPSGDSPATVVPPVSPQVSAGASAAPVRPQDAPTPPTDPNASPAAPVGTAGQPTVPPGSAAPVEAPPAGTVVPENGAAQINSTAEPPAQTGEPGFINPQVQKPAVVASPDVTETTPQTPVNVNELPGQPGAAVAETSPGQAATAAPVEAQPAPVAPPKSARQLQKERMAALTAPSKGAAFVAPDVDKAPDVGSAPTAPQIAHDSIIQALTETLRPLKKGQDLQPHIDRIMAHIEAMTQLKTKDGSFRYGSDPASIQGLLRDYAQQHPGKIPGTTTNYGEVADRISRKVTQGGIVKAPDAIEVKGAEEARRGPAGAGVKPEDDENVGVRDLEENQIQTPEEAAAAAEAPEPVEEATPVKDMKLAGTGSAGSGGKAREIDRLHEAVLDGRISPQEASERYGMPNADGGRPRKFPTYAHYLDAKIEEARDPKTLEKIINEGKAIEARKTDGKLYTKQMKSAETARINKLLDETGEEHAQQLEGIRDELRDPVGAATGHDYLREVDQAPTALSQGSSRYVRMARDPRVSAPIERALAASEKYNTPFTTHDALRQIVGSPLVKSEAAPLHALARRLLHAAPDIPVMSHEYALENGHTVPRHSDGAPIPTDRFRGAAMHGPDGSISHIILQGYEHGQGSQPIETLLHEVMHSVTAPMLNSIKHQPEHPVNRAINAMGRELERQFPYGSAHAEIGEDPNALRHAFKNAHELHTMLMTNPSLQMMAARAEASPEFLEEMKASGLPLRDTARTVWSGFVRTMRRMLGLGDTAHGSEHTLLDHLLRASHEITDVGERYNRAMPDPVVRGYAEPLLRASGGSIGKQGVEQVTKALGHVDWGGLGDKARKALLAGVNTDAIIRWNRDLFKPSDRLLMKGNPLDRFRQSMEDMAKVAKGAHDKFADTVNRTLGQMNSLGKVEQDKLGRLMNDATLAGVRLGRDLPAGANAHVANTDELTALQGRWDSLGKQSQAIYKDTEGLYNQWHKAERAARLAATIRNVLPDATDAHRKELNAALKSQKSIKDFLESQDTNPLAASFGDEWQRNRSVVRAIAKIHERGMVPGDYFPLRRFGNYVVRYGSGDDYGLEMFESKAEAQRRYDELKAKDVEDLHQVQERRVSSSKGASPLGPDVQAVHDRVAALLGQDAAQHVTDIMNTDMLEHMDRADLAKTRMRRKGIQGASTDIKRVFAQEFVAHGTRLGHATHDGDRADALRDMELVADDLSRGEPGEQIRARAVYNELEKRASVGDNTSDTLAGIARKASSLGYVQSLMSFSHILTSALETHMVSSSTLGARHGFVSAGISLSKALSDVSPTLMKQGATMTFKAMGKGLKAADWNLSQVAKERLIAKGASAAHMNKLFSALDGAGLIDHTMEREMQRIAGGYGQSMVGKGWQRFVDLNSAAAHASDVANKSAVAKAAFDLEMRKSGGNVDASTKYAVETLRQATPNYNLGNKARITTNKGALGNFAAPIMQFKQYGIHMYGLIANLTRESIHGADDMEKAEARKALAGVIASHALMAGGLTLIADPLRYIGGAYDFATGQQQPHDYENDVRGWLTDTFGQELGMVLARGAPYLAGIDIHRRVGLDNMLAVPEISAFTGPGVLQGLATAMTGAAGEDAANMVGGLGKIAQGDLFGGLQALVPRSLRDPMKAIKLDTQGVTDSHGKTILPPDKLAGSDIAAQALGFQPADVSEFREGRYAVQQEQQETKEDRQSLVNSWVSAAPADRGAVMTDIRLYNQRHPGQWITVEQLYKQLHSRTKSVASPGAFGLKLPKGVKSTAGDFANY